MSFAANVREEGRRGYGEHTGKEVSRPAVSAGCGRGVRAVGTDHVVDGCHVDAVVCNSYDGGKDHGANPVNGRAPACPGETNQTDG